MSALYLFIYRKLVDGCVEHDAAPVDEALELLRFERETWSMLLGKIASESAQITEGAGVAESSPDAAGSLSVEG
jgi:flagellin-specific chaperone FliS